MNKILIRFDDICPTMDWQEWNKAVDVVNEYGIKPLLGIIPDCQDPVLHINKPRFDFWEYIRNLQQQGWTIAMHGYQHIFDTIGKGLVTPVRSSEFAGHSYEVQYKKIKKGKIILESNGIYTDIFFAPAHSYDSNTLKALVANGFKYLSDGKTSKAVLRNGIICLPCRSTGVPKIKGNDKYYTAVFHTHEWKESNKSRCFNTLQYLCKLHSTEIVNFNLYKKQQLGFFYLEVLIEKIYVLLQYKIKHNLRKYLRKD